MTHVSVGLWFFVGQRRVSTMRHARTWPKGCQPDSDGRVAHFENPPEKAYASALSELCFCLVYIRLCRRPCPGCKRCCITHCKAEDKQDRRPQTLLSETLEPATQTRVSNEVDLLGSLSRCHEKKRKNKGAKVGRADRIERFDQGLRRSP